MKCEPSKVVSNDAGSSLLLDSDDNSSIQSSPWQRDHCWKQTQPRHNISKEMVLFFHRPERLRLSTECQKAAKSKRRRPLDKFGDIKFFKSEKLEEPDKDSNGVESKSNEEKANSDEEQKSTTDSQSSQPDKPEADGKGKLDKILKKLTDRMVSALALNGNGANGHHHHHHAPPTPTTYSLASHIASTINSQPHQHVSPRKRILRELEKVSLEDTKRSRPKTQQHQQQANGNSIPMSAISPQLTNGSIKSQHEKAATNVPPVSRPISSYSITSLLAHNNSTTTASSASSGCNSINEHSNDSSSASHYQHHRDGGAQQQQQQRLSLSQHSPPKSPSMMHQHQQQKRKSPNTTPPGNGNGSNAYHSPNHSPSPEHHAFQKYRPTQATHSSSSPYGNSYSSPNYMRGSPSPHGADGFNNNRLRTTVSYQHSPSHYDSSPSSQSFATPRDSSLSPNVVERSTTTTITTTTTNSSRSTPTISGTSVIRTLPKKTAALRQQFSSPTGMDNSSNNKKPVIKSEKSMDVDLILRPALMHPSVSHQPPQMYPYMYPTLSYLPAAVPPYYHHPAFAYNPMMAAAAAGYRIPGVLPPGAMPGYPGASMSAAQMTGSSPPISSSYDKNSNGQRNSIISPPPATHSSLSPYVPTSPWNPIPLTNHSINDGNLIAKSKDEPSSGDL